VERRSPVELIVAVDIAAMCILASIFLAGLGAQPALLVLLGGLAAAVSMRPIAIRAIKLQLAPSDAFVFAALAILGPLAAILVGLMGNAAAAVGGGRRKRLVRLAFNSGNTVFSTASAWWVFSLTGGEVGGAPGAVVLPLAAAAAVYFLANAVLVTGPISYERRRPYVTTMTEVLLWSAPTIMVGYALAMVMATLIGLASIWVLLIMVVPCWMLAFFYRVHVSRKGLIDRAAIR
jgi:hypothetical protein